MISKYFPMSMMMPFKVCRQSKAEKIFIDGNEILYILILLYMIKNCKFLWYSFCYHIYRLNTTTFTKIFPFNIIYFMYMIVRFNTYVPKYLHFSCILMNMRSKKHMNLSRKKNCR